MAGFSFTIPNKKEPSQGFQLPSLGQAQAPGTAGIQQDVGGSIQRRLGEGSTPFSVGEEFKGKAPGVEGQVEGFVNRSLSQPAAGGGEASQQYFNTQKRQLGETFDERRLREEERYNRLGLSTSTPGLQAQAGVDKEQGLAEQSLAATIAYENISRDQQAAQIANQIAQTGLGLGAQQTGREQFSQQLAFQDLIRQSQNEQSAAQQGLGFLQQGAQGPQGLLELELFRQNPELLQQLAYNPAGGGQPFRTLG